MNLVSLFGSLILRPACSYSGCHNLAFSCSSIQTLPDYVVATSFIKYDGTRVDLKRADDPKGFALKVVHFGLLGITICKDNCG